MKNSNDTVGYRTRNLQSCGAMPQLTAPRRVPQQAYKKVKQSRYGPEWPRRFQEVKFPILRKAVPVLAWSGPEGSRKLRFPY
jgi:hypothetical protein